MGNTGGPPPLEVGEPMIVGPFTGAYIIASPSPKDMGHPAILRRIVSTA